MRFPILIALTLVPLASGGASRGESPKMNSLAYVRGQFDYARHPDFVKVPKPYSDGNERYLRKEVMRAYKKMYRAAKRDGITLQIISATRSFNEQKYLWNEKWTGKRRIGKTNYARIRNKRRRAQAMLRYSAMPASSRHHWGTEVDINRTSAKYYRRGRGLREYRWLRKHAKRFGFCQPYRAKGRYRRHGYEEERWHWSYRPTSRKIMRYARRKLRNKHITGFYGADHAKRLNIVRHYVLSVDRSCR